MTDIERRVDFSRCHTIWKTNSVNLLPISMEYHLICTIVALLACSINLTILGTSIRSLYKWSVSEDKNWLTGPGSGLVVKSIVDMFKSLFGISYFEFSLRNS